MRYLLILLLCTSCLTVKRIEKNCDKFASVCVTDVKKEVKIITDTKTVIEYRDTTIYVQLPGKVVEKKMPVYITRGIVNSDLSILVTPYSRSTARVFKSQLEHYLTQNDSTLQLEIDNAVKEVRIHNTEKWKSEETQTIEIIKNSKFAKLCIRLWILVLVIGIGYIGIKYKSRILRLFIK